MRALLGFDLDVWDYVMFAAVFVRVPIGNFDWS